MGGGFSSSSKQPPPKQRPTYTVSQVDRAILDLKNARDGLTRYRRKLEVDEKKIVERAKAAKAKGDTKTALNLLRLKKHKHQQMDQVNDQLLTVLQMVETIEGKQNEALVLDAIASGKDSLAKLHEETTLDMVIDLMDQVQEQNELEQEISNVLGDFPVLTADAEEQVLAELEALDQPVVETPIHLPEVPTTELPTAAQMQEPERVSASKPARVAVPS